MCFLSILFFLVASISSVHAVKLDYNKTWTAAGDKFPDFSYTGYHHSERPLPEISTPANKILSPSSGDQSPIIQAALDNVTQAGRGIVELEDGTYFLSSGLQINNNTTLRGAGLGLTVLELKSLQGDIITMGNSPSRPKQGKSVLITNTYVPAGTHVVHVEDASRLAVGMNVWVERAVTQAWTDAQGMTPYAKWLKVSTQHPLNYVI